MFLFHIPRSSIHDIPNSRATTSHERPKSWLISSLITARRNGDAIGEPAPNAALEASSGNARHAQPEAFRNSLRDNRVAIGINSAIRKLQSGKCGAPPRILGSAKLYPVLPTSGPLFILQCSADLLSQPS